MALTGVVCIDSVQWLRLRELSQFALFSRGDNGCAAHLRQIFSIYKVSFTSTSLCCSQSKVPVFAGATCGNKFDWLLLQEPPQFVLFSRGDSGGAAQVRHILTRAAGAHEDAVRQVKQSSLVAHATHLVGWGKQVNCLFFLLISARSVTSSPGQQVSMKMLSDR